MIVALQGSFRGDSFSDESILFLFSRWLLKACVCKGELVSSKSVAIFFYFLFLLMSLESGNCVLEF